MTSRLARQRMLALVLAGLVAATWRLDTASAETTHGGPSSAAPVDTVTALYRKPQGLSDGPFLSARLRRLFAAQRARGHRTGDAMAGLDFNYACSCQDYDDAFKQSLSYAETGRTSRSATVTARFMLFGAGREVTYSLIRENGKWLIDDISGSAGPGHDWVMSRLLRMR
ncbi:DUF3828 domain-containing protein [Phreatobacter stygius]|uniref:DUF3828 domain-containing protein n=1 Tax=Phreatobacter stygius TaxID=1940610 RepID=A0A4D7AWC1_9HYPH|nr:DUF3828 domain-containing protein [Phreatobacter stygius]QCI63273.1 DUF3828 domain-containing protein [Phreatobacter stygius]